MGSWFINPRLGLLPQTQRFCVEQFFKTNNMWPYVHAGKVPREGSNIVMPVERCLFQAR